MQEFIILNRKHPKLIQIISDNQSGLRRVNDRKEFLKKPSGLFICRVLYLFSSDRAYFRY